MSASSTLGEPEPARATVLPGSGTGSGGLPWRNAATAGASLASTAAS
jgi:hypothetical protein